MKIRTGFVSNSSSSSFVVAFHHKPKDAADLQKMMFGTQNVHYADIYSCFPDERTNEVPTDRIAKAIFENIKKKATKDDIIESIYHGYFDAYIDESICPGHFEVMETPEWKETGKMKESPDYYKRMSDLCRKADEINIARATKIAEWFMQNNKNTYKVVMEFSDNEGPFNAMLEHSNIFGRLQHIRTSYH